MAAPAGGVEPSAGEGREGSALDAGARRPVVSIVTPTMRRPELLRRAVASALAQSFADFEVVVSDDAREEGAVARDLARAGLLDGRVRVVLNEGVRGQASNMNRAMRAARGEWIKPLFDDDALKPGALEAFARAARARPDAAVVCCLAEHYADGRLRRAERAGRRAPLEFVAAEAAHRAMFLQDVDIGTPTQVMFPRRIVEAGVLFEQPPGITSCVDAWFFVRALRHGGLLMINRALVEVHQGGHETVTSGTSDDERYAQFELLREWLAPLLTPGGAPTPGVGAARGMLRLIRAAREVKMSRPLRGAARAASVRDPAAWGLFARWALRRAFPGRFEAVPRMAIEAAPARGRARAGGRARGRRGFSVVGGMGATGFEPVTPAM